MERIDRVCLMAAILGAGQDLTLQGRAEIVDEALDYERRVRGMLTTPQHAEPTAIPANAPVPVLIAVLDAARDVVNAHDEEAMTEIAAEITGCDCVNPEHAHTADAYRAQTIERLRAVLNTLSGQ